MIVVPVGVLLLSFAALVSRLKAGNGAEGGAAFRASTATDNDKEDIVGIGEAGSRKAVRRKQRSISDDWPRDHRTGSIPAEAERLVPMLATTPQDDNPTIQEGFRDSVSGAEEPWSHSAYAGLRHTSFLVIQVFATLSNVIRCAHRRGTI